MRRDLFLLFEKLQISRTERVAMGGLTGLLALLGTLLLVVEQQPAYSEEEYRELEALFEERSRRLTEEREEILARYRVPDLADEPDNASAATTSADHEVNPRAGVGSSSEVDVSYREEAASAESVVSGPGVKSMPEVDSDTISTRQDTLNDTTSGKASVDGSDDSQARQGGSTHLDRGELNTDGVGEDFQAPQGGATHSDRVDLNTASHHELQQLPGIGPAYATRIIERRERVGPFTSPEQLIEIRGIGEKRLEALRPLVVAGGE